MGLPGPITQSWWDFWDKFCNWLPHSFHSTYRWMGELQSFDKRAPFQSFICIYCTEASQISIKSDLGIPSNSIQPIYPSIFLPELEETWKSWAYRTFGYSGLYTDTYFISIPWHFAHSAKIIILNKPICISIRWTKHSLACILETSSSPDILWHM